MTKLKTIKFLGRKILRRGRLGFRLPQEIAALETSSPGKVSQYQLEKLKNLLEYVSIKVPWYEKRYSSLSLPPTTTSNLKEILDALPILTRKEVARHNKEFKSVTPAGLLFIKTYTSGSTGTPVTVYRSPGSIALEHAFIRRVWGWAGFREGDRRMTIRGDPVVPVSRKKPPFWFYNRWENQLIASSYHISAENIPYYLDALTRFDPLFIQGYPSSILPLARWRIEHGGPTLGIKAVLTSSETVTETFRETIWEAFGCPVFDYYGHAERTVMIGTCEYGTYHQFPGYGLAEFIPSEKSPGFSEIITTGFIDRAMPLIRYRTGDLVEYDPDDQCRCGRPFPVVKKLIGRKDDPIITASGRIVGRLDHIFKGGLPILEARVLQERPGKVTIELVPAGNPDKSYRKVLRRNCIKWLGADTEVEIREVREIPRGRHGKFRSVISTIGSERKG